MESVLKQFLRGQTAVARTYPTWQWRDNPLRMIEDTYLSPILPPDALISSVRAILFKDDAVMVIQDHKDEPYIVPGGRREPGESILETLHREVLEETGWRLKNTAVLGFVHFHHLDPKPADYPYPFPDFCHAIFTAWADRFYPNALQEDAYVTSTSFKPVADVLSWQFYGGQNQLLSAALKQLDW